MRARPVPQTRAEAESRRAAVRAKILRQIGGLPAARTPLNARVTGGFTRDGYRVENVIYESQPGLAVTANLYLPAGNGPFPAVLGVAGHSNNGKASATYQHAWISMARRGFVVLAFDPPGQGERLETLDPATGLARAGTGTAEHIHNGLQHLLTGHHFARYEIWDGIRGFDYLASRPEVDARRIAVAGNSGGGTQAAYLAVLEPRLAAIVSSCYMTGWRELWSKPGPQDAEQVFPGFLADGLDFADFAFAAAPKPFLMTTAVRDFFPIASARQTYEEIRKFYTLFDAASRAGYFEYDDTHGWSKPRREAAYQFLQQALAAPEHPREEAPLTPEPEQLLYATPTGQVQSSAGAGGETSQSLNARYARELARQRPPLTRQMVEQRIRYQPTGPERAAVTKADLVAIHMAGADAADLAKAGRTVSAIALPQADAARGYSPLYQLAMRALLVGRTLLGLEVQQVLAALEGHRDVHLYARGTAAVVALHAAYLSPTIAELTLDEMPFSYLAVTQARLHRGLVDVIVPGVLADYDLPDLARAIAPRKVTLIDTKDPAGLTLLHGAVQPLYPQARLVYRREGELLGAILGRRSRD